MGEKPNEVKEVQYSCNSCKSFYEHAFPRVDISIFTNFILKDYWVETF